MSDPALVVPAVGIHGARLDYLSLWKCERIVRNKHI